MSDARVERLWAALDLADAGVDLMRQNLRRAHPQADDDFIERLLIEWIDNRPGAERGDYPGRLRRAPGP